MLDNCNKIRRTMVGFNKSITFVLTVPVCIPLDLQAGHFFYSYGK